MIQTLTGRRNCYRCGCWRLTLDFRAAKRNEEGEAIALQGYCNICHRQTANSNTKKSKVKKRKTGRAWYRKHRAITVGRGPRVDDRFVRRGEVSRIPFAEWLDRQRKIYGISELSEMTGMDQRFIYTIIRGYSKHQGKIHPVDYIELSTVDHALVNWGNPGLLEQLYPHDCTKP
jgi:hypothetical protein